MESDIARIALRSVESKSLENAVRSLAVILKMVPKEKRKNHPAIVLLANHIRNFVWTTEMDFGLAKRMLENAIN